MYLTQLLLNPAHAEARRDLADAYQMHRSLSRAFATSADAPVPRFLWRLARERTPGAGNTVLLQAGQPGHWQSLGAAPGYLLAPATDKQVALDRLVIAGQRCRFRLRANPAVKREGKRWGLHDEAMQLAWLQRQGERLGFAVQGADVSQRERVQVPQQRKATRITVDSVLFDGLLTVVDADLLRPAMLAGIGPAKALGLGMLSLAPV